MKKYKEWQLNNIKDRKSLIEIIEEIESNAVQIDMTKYQKDTMPYLRQAILDHQDSVIVEGEIKFDETTITTEVIEEKGFDTELDDFNKDNTNVEIVHELPKPRPRKVKIIPDWKELPDDTNEEFVRKIYIKYLGREPDKSGKEHYINTLDNGLARKMVENIIRTSPEGLSKNK